MFIYAFYVTNQVFSACSNNVSCYTNYKKEIKLCKQETVIKQKTITLFFSCPFRFQWFLFNRLSFLLVFSVNYGKQRNIPIKAILFLFETSANIKIFLILRSLRFYSQIYIIRKKNFNFIIISFVWDVCKTNSAYFLWL